jgi:soluble cytochrome b562
MDNLAGDVGLGGDLDNLESAVGDVTTETEKLNKEFGNTVTEVEKVIASVDKASSEYLNHQKVVDGTIKKYEELATSIDDAKRAAQEFKVE